MAAFTLVELLTVLAIAAILLSLAVPRFKATLAGIRVSSEINRLMGSINLARSNAIRLNTAVTMCPFAVAGNETLKCEGNHQAGWIVFVNPNRDAVVDAEEEVLRVFPASDSRLTISNRAGSRLAGDRLTYLADGRAGRTMTLQVCPRNGAEGASRSVVVSNVGRPRVARNWGSCPGG